MPVRTIRVLVAEDYPPFRRFLAATIRKQIGIANHLRGGGRSGETVQKAEALQPELVLLDIGLPAERNRSRDKSENFLLTLRSCS